MLKCLQQLAEVFPHRSYARAAQAIASGLGRGYSFSSQLRTFPRQFPAFYAALVEAGENGDALLPALETLAHYYGEREAIRAKLQRILFYPFLLITAAVGSGLFALWYVVPTFNSLYTSLDTEVPPATSRVFALASVLTPPRLAGGILALIILLILVYLLTAKAIKWPALARLPLAGAISCYWFCQVSAMIVGAGHTLEQALAMAAAVSRRGPAVDALAEIRKGVSLYEALRGGPGVLRSFVAQGECTGELPTALERAAEYYRLQVEESMEDVQRFLEPTAVLFVGALVAGMLVILMMPMLQLARAF